MSADDTDRGRTELSLIGPLGTPDQTHGGNCRMVLQRMWLHAHGDKIILLPAGPKDLKVARARSSVSPRPRIAEQSSASERRVRV